jgi:hypothetical protein
VSAASITATGSISAASITATGSISAASITGTCISDSTSTTSSTKAASLTAVKSAYDQANKMLPLAGGIMTGDINFDRQESERFFKVTLYDRINCEGNTRVYNRGNMTETVYDRFEAVAPQFSIMSFECEGCTFYWNTTTDPRFVGTITKKVNSYNFGVLYKISVLVDVDKSTLTKISFNNVETSSIRLQYVKSPSNIVFRPNDSLDGNDIYISSYGFNGPNSLPIGSITAFAGATVPTGSHWLICDGRNFQNTASGAYTALKALLGSWNTPNLLDKFLRGSATPRETSGSGTVTLTTDHLPSHNHSFDSTTGLGGTHNHWTTEGQYSVANGLSKGPNNDTNYDFDGRTWQDDDKNLTYINLGGLTTTVAADHTHTIKGNTGNSGKGNSFSIVPTHYTVVYIIKAL